MKTSRSYMVLAWLVGALSLIIFRPNALTWAIALMAGLLVVTVHDRSDLAKLLVVTGAFGLYFMINHQGLIDQSHQGNQVNSWQKILVYPDDVLIGPDGQIKGQAHLPSGQPVWFSYAAKDSADLADWHRYPGQTLFIEGQGNLARILPATNFYQFDFRDFSQTRGITHRLVLKTAHFGPVRAKNFWQAWTFRWRSWHWALADRAHHLPQPLANYALALLLGAKDQTLYADNPKIQELGLIHLFSLSGFHVAFLLALVRWLGRRLGLYREITLAIMAVVLPSFYWLTACPPILVRAVVAGEGRILRQAGGWRVDPVTIWSWSLLVALAVHPQILLTVGGQLSFALTLALTLMPATWPSWQKGVFLSVLTFPIIVAQQYVWNCWQTVANLLAVPIFSTVILPTVLVAFLLVPVPGLAPTCNWIVASFDQTIAWVGSWPGQVVVGALAWPVLLTLFCLPWFAIGANHRCRRWLVSTWIVVLLFGWTTVRWRSTGEYTTFDIGQGDAAVLREPWNRSVTLIDTGGKVSFQRPEFGQNSGNQSPASQAKSQEGLARSVIVPYLHALGIGRINTLSLSHQDQDHLGDARVILTTFRVDQVLVPAGLPNQPAFQRKVKPYLNGAKVVEGTDQVQVSHLPLKILHPFQPGIGENEDSLALAGRLGPLTLFTAGDLDQMGEAAIQAKYSNFRPDIVKFGHHGSKTATNPTVMATWRPKYGLISAGRDNRYGHPNQETLETARANQMIVYDTRRQGMLRYVYDLNRKGYFEVTSSHDLTDPKKSN